MDILVIYMSIINIWRILICTQFKSLTLVYILNYLNFLSWYCIRVTGSTIFNEKLNLCHAWIWLHVGIIWLVYTGWSFLWQGHMGSLDVTLFMFHSSHSLQLVIVTRLGLLFSCVWYPNIHTRLWYSIEISSFPS